MGLVGGFGLGDGELRHRWVGLVVDGGVYGFTY
jgi:hypothetical protein